MDFQMRVTVSVVVGMIIIAALSKMTSKTASASTPHYSKRYLRKMNRILQQATKWHNASRQDIDPLMHLIHSSYAMAYGYAAKNLVRDTVLDSVAGMNFDDFIERIENDQSDAIQKLAAVCPQIRTSGFVPASSPWA